MIQLRITKYNPIHRNELGHYLKPEWTCPSEVGSSYGGVRFKKRDYFDVENRYVASISGLLDSANLDHLRVVSLEKRHLRRFLFERQSSWLVNPEFVKVNLFEDKKVHRNEIETISRMILRNFIWCKLEVAGKFFVHFGWDYYMFIGTHEFNDSDAKNISNLHLFSEEFESPHHSENHTWSIQIGKKGQPYVENEIEMEGVTPDFIRSALNLSQEHPGTHNFEIVEENHAPFSKFCRFDFVLNDYHVYCDSK